jgi:hypothetical protein
MTPTERAALLLKVQRALDAKGYGRRQVADALFETMPFDDLSHLEIIKGKVEVQDGVHNDKEYDVFAKTLATFTFAELFPELEWEEGTLKGYGDSIQSAAIPGYALRIYGGGLLELQNSFDSSQELSLLFRTPERAKRAAQSIADLLAEAGRES